MTGVVVVVGLAGIYLDLKLNEQREQGMWIITFNWTIQGEPDKYMTRILYVDQVCLILTWCLKMEYRSFKVL